MNFVKSVISFVISFLVCRYCIMNIPIPVLPVLSLYLYMFFIKELKITNSRSSVIFFIVLFIFVIPTHTPSHINTKYGNLIIAWIYFVLDIASCIYASWRLFPKLLETFDKTDYTDNEIEYYLQQKDKEKH